MLTKVAGAAAVVALLVPSTAAATSRPSERSCLIAWNGAANAANRARLAGQPRWQSAVLRAASIGTVGLAPLTSTDGPGCSLMLSRRGLRQQIAGRWIDGSVRTWRFWPPIRTSETVPAPNVRILADGRVTKIYAR